MVDLIEDLIDTVVKVQSALRGLDVMRAHSPFIGQKIVHGVVLMIAVNKTGRGFGRKQIGYLARGFVFSAAVDNMVFHKRPFAVADIVDYPLQELLYGRIGIVQSAKCDYIHFVRQEITDRILNIHNYASPLSTLSMSIIQDVPS